MDQGRWPTLPHGTLLSHGSRDLRLAPHPTRRHSHRATPSGVNRHVTKRTSNGSTTPQSGTYGRGRVYGGGARIKSTEGSGDRPRGTFKPRFWLCPFVTAEGGGGPQRRGRARITHVAATFSSGLFRVDPTYRENLPGTFPVPRLVVGMHRGDAQIHLAARKGHGTFPIWGPFPHVIFPVVGGVPICRSNKRSPKDSVAV